jgi:hypothetical protein
LLQIGNSLESVEQYTELCPIEDISFSGGLISTRDVEETFIQAIEKTSAPAFNPFKVKVDVPVPSVERSVSFDSSTSAGAMSIENLLC